MKERCALGSRGIDAVNGRKNWVVKVLRRLNEYIQLLDDCACLDPDKSDLANAGPVVAGGFEVDGGEGVGIRFHG